MVFVTLPLIFGAENIILNPVADTYVDSYNPSSNYGGNNFLDVGYSDLSFMENTEENVYLLFDLSTLSTDVFEITSATLDLHCYHAGIQTSQIGVYACSDTEWNEIELTWENAPVFSDDALDTVAVAFTGTWYSWDVTEYVINSQENYMTLVVSSVKQDNIYSSGFSSKDSYSNYPRLIIEYEPLVQEPPEASFTYMPLDPKVNVTITFNSSSSIDADGTIISYSWDFGDGTTSTSQNPTHAYDQTGLYTVSLTVADDDGITDTFTATLAEVVIPEFSSNIIIMGLMSLTLMAILLTKKINRKTVIVN